MRAREFLLEYNRQKTEQNYGDKIVMIARRDPTIPQQVRKQADNLQLIDIVISQLEKADPTKNKEYTQGLAKIYANGGLKMEDASSTLADYLTKFHKLKVKRMIPPPYNDFLRYAKVSDMMDVVDQLPDPDQDKKEVDKGTAVEYYNDEQIRVIVPKDEAAACYYGQGTRWCTAVKTNNMFDGYNRSGPLYIVIPKHPRHPGEKYQIHFEDGQCMNEEDDSENLADIADWYPSIRKAFAKQGKEFGLLGLMTKEERAKLAEQGAAYIKAHGVDQGNGIITVNLNEPNADVEEFYLNSRIANMVNAAAGTYDWNFPVSGQGEGSLYMAYAIIDTQFESGKDNTWVVWGEVSVGGYGSTNCGMYWTEDPDDMPHDDTMRDCVDEISDLMDQLVDTGGDYSMDDPFAEQRKVLNTLRQKYGA